MKNIKKKTSLVFAYNSLSIFLGIAIGGILIWSAIYLYHFINPEYHFPNYWSKGITSHTTLLISDRFGFAAIPAKFVFRMNETEIFLSFLHLLIIMSGVTIGTYFLLRVIKNVFNIEPFLAENIKNIKIVGYTVIITPILEGIIKIYLIYTVDAVPVLSKGMTGTVCWSMVERIPEELLLDLFFLMGGFILIIISQVFEYGVKIKQENDLTV